MADTEKDKGVGFVVSCTACGRSRVVYHDAIMRGDWQTCPHCAQDKREQVD
jgi:hypothetical protein